MDAPESLSEISPESPEGDLIQVAGSFAAYKKSLRAMLSQLLWPTSSAHAS